MQKQHIVTVRVEERLDALPPEANAIQANTPPARSAPIFFRNCQMELSAA